MSEYVMVVMTNPVEGRDGDYNDWYDNRHLEDVLRIPGIVSAQRFHLAPAQRYDPPHPFAYLALYTIETDDIAAVLDELKARSGTALMPISEAMASKRMAYVFEPFGKTAAEPMREA